MKHFKITAGIIVFFLMLVPFVSFAQGEQSEQKGIHEPGTGIENPEIKKAGQETRKGMELPVPTKRMLKNQGEEQKNAVQLQQNAQTGQRAINGNAQGNQTKSGQLETTSKGQNQASDKATQRRSRVANAVQEMLQVAERNQGVGQQIRTIAQAQNQNQEKIETEMKQVKNRGRLKKFFFGPDYKNLNSVEDRLANHEQKLEELKQIANQVTNEADVIKLQEQITVMEQVKDELEKETIEERKGFSLFGWLNRMISK